MDNYSNSSYISNNGYSNLSTNSTGGYIHTYKNKKDMKEKPELSDEEKQKIMDESFISDNPLHRIFADVEDNYNKLVTKPMENMEISEDHIITFNIGSTDPEDCGRRLYDRKAAVFKPNTITALVGCNGSGKSTMICRIIDIIKSNRFCYISYNNMSDGASRKASEFFGMMQIEAGAALWSSSEGENILALSLTEINKIKKVLEGKIIRDYSYRPYRDTDHVFIILDAIDSGSSIDNIINIKNHLDILIEIAKKNNKNLYIITAANSFELVRNVPCWDVQHSKEVFFGTDYEKYRKFVVNSRNRILKQWDRMNSKKEEKDVQTE